MDTFSERFRVSCFNGWQPVDEHRGEDVDHYEAAVAYAQRLSVSCKADWWQAKGAENAERRQEAERLAAESERNQKASKHVLAADEARRTGRRRG